MARKTPQEVAQEQLAVAERVVKTQSGRVEKLTADLDKAKANLRLAERKVRAARMIALDEDLDAIDSDASEAAEPADDDVLS